MKNAIRSIKSTIGLDISNCYVVELEGNTIKGKEDYLKAVEQKFLFPGKCEGLWDRYYDWMTDLDWISEDKIIIIIKSFAEFLSSDPIAKKIVLETFEEDILPFWEEEVKHVVVGGRPKEFQVYLID